MTDFRSSVMLIRKLIVYAQVKVYLALGSPEKAIKLLEHGLNKWPGDPSLLSNLQRIFRSNRDWNGYFKVYHIAEENYPTDLSIKWNFGAALLEFSKYEEALPYFKYCIENWSQSDNPLGLANIHARLGICYAYLFQWNLAEEELQTAQKTAPWDLDMCFGMLLLYQGTNQIDKISNFLDEKIKNYPHLYPLYYWKADYLHNTIYKPQEALRWYRSALNRYSNKKNKYYETHYLFGLITTNYHEILEEYIKTLLECGKEEEALGFIRWDYLKKLGTSNHNKFPYINCYILLNEIKRAEKMLHGIPKKNRSAEYWTCIAMIEMKQNKLADALNSVNQALTMDQEQNYARDILGKIQINNKDWEAAAYAYSSLAKVDPFSAEWLGNLGHCYFEMGNLEKASAIYERVVPISPYNAEAWVNLGRVYYHLGKMELAYSACVRGLSFNKLNEEKREQAIKITEAIRTNKDVM